MTDKTIVCSMSKEDYEHEQDLKKEMIKCKNCGYNFMLKWYQVDPKWKEYGIICPNCDTRTKITEEYGGDLMSIKEKQGKIKELCNKLENSRNSTGFVNREVILKEIRILQGEIITHYELLIPKLVEVINKNNKSYVTSSLTTYRQNEPFMKQINEDELLKEVEETIGSFQ